VTPWPSAGSSASSPKKVRPSLSSATAIDCGASFGCPASVRGRSSLRLEVISGAVIMKITSSTSMTSISGVMLMSLIGCTPGVRSRRPKAMSGRFHGHGRAPGRSQARPRPKGHEGALRAPWGQRTYS